MLRGINAAHARNIPTIAHLGISWKTAAEAGIDAIVHAIPSSIEDLAVDQRGPYQEKARPGGFSFFEWWEHGDANSPEMQAIITALKENNVTVDATLIAFYLAFWGDQSDVRDEYLHLAHPAMIENWNALFRFDLGWTETDYQRAKAVWPKVLTFVKALYDAGVPLTLGTDQGNPFVAPGASLIQEMELHADAGIPHWGVLRMATTHAAKTLGLENNTGKIASGFDADFVFTKSDPSEDFGAFHHAHSVVNNGSYYDATALKTVTAKHP